jgi:hypothetical protein
VIRAASRAGRDGVALVVDVGQERADVRGVAERELAGVLQRSGGFQDAVGLSAA